MTVAEFKKKWSRYAMALYWDNLDCQDENSEADCEA
jgi:hypothetical protein